MENFEEGLVTIIIPVFNREKLLPETLDSILAQTYTRWECIIVDDGSTDSSLKIAIGYASKDVRIKVSNRPWYKKKGANSCRNNGFKLSKGEFIQWFDSDDLMSSCFIEKKVNSFISTNDDMVICSASFFSEKVENIVSRSNKSINPVTDNPALEYFSGDFWFGTPQAMFRRKVIASLPYVFNTKLNRNQETELFVRILLSELKISFINESLLDIRIHNSSISGKYSMMSFENKMIVDIDAYISMYLAFKKSKKLTNEVNKFFMNYFIKCLKKMNNKNFKYYKLFVFGNFYSLFPSRYLATKIFIYRCINL
jgi:glycosyltransferase involved in cell wall biosynthesis